MPQQELWFLIDGKRGGAPGVFCVGVATKGLISARVKKSEKARKKTEGLLERIRKERKINSVVFFAAAPDRRVAWKYASVVSIGPSQRAIAQRSTLCWSRSIATGCPSTCIEMRFLASLGRCFPALATCLARTRSAPSLLSGPPRALGNNGSAGSPRRSRNQARGSTTTSSCLGVERSLRPFGSVLNPGSQNNVIATKTNESDMRSPVWAATRSKIQSRRSPQVVRSGAENSASIWGRVR